MPLDNKKCASTGNLQSLVGSLFHSVSTHSTPISEAKSQRRSSKSKSKTSLIAEDSPRKTEAELMADIFKTASELEDLAKQARRARRRRTHRDTSGHGECEASDTGSVSSLSGMLPAFFSPKAAAVTKEKTSRTPSSRSGSRGGTSRRRSRSLTGLGRGRKEMPKLETTASNTARRCVVVPDIYKPTFYQDSDDEDDDLILDPDENLDDLQREIQKDVTNMAITIHRYSQAA
jgi:hypothetical protein